MALRSSWLCSVLAAGMGPFAVSAPAFLSAESCALCHSRRGVLTGAEVGHYDTWRFSVMSSAARDPYWKLRVEAESAAPGAQTVAVQDKCLRCHAAADQYAYRTSGATMRLSDLTDAGREGVTCTVCHRIDPAGLGTSRSLTGGFQFPLEPVIFGPHKRPFSMPMLHHTGYQPVVADHILDSSLCGTCHTLLVSDSSGGTFPEQATYLEWLASEWPLRGVSCQSCHVPVLRDEVGKTAADYIAHRPPGGPFPPTRPRTPIGVHTFIGGNVQLLELLAEEDAGFAVRAAATRKLLGTALALEATPQLSRKELAIAVTIRNRTGHKLPTGLPGRRLWLHLTLFDSHDRVLFESGGWSGSSGELKYATAFEPHRQSIRQAAETMIYEAVMEDVESRITGLLTRARRYRKDNRLLPAGSGGASRLPAAVSADWIAPVGTARDKDFAPGRDTVTYRIPLTDRSLARRVAVEACFQSIPPADAAVLSLRHRAPVVIATVELLLDRRSISSESK